MKKLINAFDKDGLYILTISLIALIAMIYLTHENIKYQPLEKGYWTEIWECEVAEHKIALWDALTEQREIAIAQRLEEEARQAEVDSQVWTAITNYTSYATTQDYIWYAWEQFVYYGWSAYDLECLITLWHRESQWNPLAHNSSSGAHGIPQSLPASKMARFGDDYWDNGYTQILWGLWYIWQRYGSPASALSHSYSVGWY